MELYTFLCLVGLLAICGWLSYRLDKVADRYSRALEAASTARFDAKRARDNAANIGHELFRVENACVRGINSLGGIYYKYTDERRPDEEGR